MAETDPDEVIRIAVGPLDEEPWKVFAFTRAHIDRTGLAVKHLLKYIAEEQDAVLVPDVACDRCDYIGRDLERHTRWDGQTWQPCLPQA